MLEIGWRVGPYLLLDEELNVRALLTYIISK